MKGIFRSQTMQRLAFAGLLGALTACDGGGATLSTWSDEQVGELHTVSISQSSLPGNNKQICFQSSNDPVCGLITYQVMVEAFIDGDNNHDYNTGYGTSHHKGDLQGIINALPYIKQSGANAIWMTPVFASHPIDGQTEWIDRLDATGYYASDFFSVDPNFGTDAQLRNLITTAHSLGLYVLFDGVFGHYKENIDQYPSPSGRLPQHGACINERLEPYAPADYALCADYGLAGNSDIPPATLDFFKEVATYWVEEYQIDGWRLDQAYQVSPEAWQAIKLAVEETSKRVTYLNDQGQPANPLGYMVAELWHGSVEPIIKQGYGTDSNPVLDSAFDFPMRYALVQTLAVEESGAGKVAPTRLHQAFIDNNQYPRHARPNLMMTNHDLVRFGDLLERGKITTPSLDSYWARHKAALSFIASYSGPITIYYGDEIGDELTGFAEKVDPCNGDSGVCDDHVSRTSGRIQGLATTIGSVPVELSTREADLLSYQSQLMRVRKTNPALYQGERLHVYSDSHLYIDYKRSTNNHVLYLLNAKNAPVSLALNADIIDSPTELLDLLSGETINASAGTFNIELQPLESRLITFTPAVLP